MPADKYEWIDFELWTLEELQRAHKIVDRLDHYHLGVFIECTDNSNHYSHYALNNVLTMFETQLWGMNCGFTSKTGPSKNSKAPTMRSIR